MVLPISTSIEDLSEKADAASNVTELNARIKNEEEFTDDENWEDESELDQSGEQFEGQSEPGTRDFSQNQVSLAFSWSLMNQLRYLSRTEGISVEDLLVELVAEGVTKRAFEDQNKPAPSHLMTRNGYVHNNSDGNAAFSQPQMSHHAQPGNNRAANNQNNRNKPGMQRNNQYNNAPRYPNPNQQNRNYQGNRYNNSQGNAVSFRQGGAPHNNPPQRHAPRPVANPNQHPNQTQRFVNDNEDGNSLLRKK
ncbi:MAG: hypothetical protein V4591_05575 [Bdellovibrionota bacterium]